MKYYIVSLLLLLVLAACGPSAQTPTPDAGQPARSTPTSDPSLVNPNTGGQTNQTGYPPPPPTLTPFPEGYPVPPTIEPVNPYPAAVDSEAVWVLHPLGQQCADTSTYTYANVQEARAGLTAAGITVYDVATVELMVCQACECPTSTHYRAQIAAADRQKATALGWQEE